MATGPEHYREAEKAIEASTWQRQQWGEQDADGDDNDLNAAMWELARAQVHATLALAAATALQNGADEMYADDKAAWVEAASEEARKR